MTDALLTTTGVSKRYGEATALADVDLSVAPGTLHCVVGPNGSGKSTLLALLLGLERPTAGTVHRPARAVGASFQRPRVYPDLTVAEHLRAFGDLAGVDAAWRARVRDALGLDAVADVPAAALSGGYAQRLDVALGLVRHPTVLVADEPLGDLDEDARAGVVETLADYATDGRSVVVSSHHVGALGPVLDRLTVLDGGRVVEDRPAAAIDTDDYEAFYRDLVA